jgi:hypothetical protein
LCPPAAPRELRTPGVIAAGNAGLKERASHPQEQLGIVRGTSTEDARQRGDGLFAPSDLAARPNQPRQGHAECVRDHRETYDRRHLVTPFDPPDGLHRQSGLLGQHLLREPGRPPKHRDPFPDALLQIVHAACKR